MSLAVITRKAESLASVNCLKYNQKKKKSTCHGPAATTTDPRYNNLQSVGNRTAALEKLTPVSNSSCSASQRPLLHTPVARSPSPFTRLSVGGVRAVNLPQGTTGAERLRERVSEQAGAEHREHLTKPDLRPGPLRPALEPSLAVSPPVMWNATHPDPIRC